MSQQFRGLFAGIFAAAAAFAVPVAPALADTTELPPGTYRKTCINISVSGTTLNALCRKSSGTRISAQLNNYASAGTRDIANCEGVLTIGRCPSSLALPGVR